MSTKPISPEPRPGVFTPTTFRGLPALRASSPFLTVTVLPAWGAKIASLLDSDGREWLWHNPYLPWQLPTVATSYVREADVGGWDECFPAVGPGPYPLPPWQGRPIRDHGEVWAHAWELEDTADGLRLATTGDEFPYRLTRTVRLAPDEPALEMRYELVNFSDAPFACLWCAHPLLALRPGMQLDLPPGTPARSSGALPARFTWPHAGRVDLSQVPAATAAWAAKVYLGPVTEGWAALSDPETGRELRFEFDPAEVPYVGLWLNYGSWSGAGSAPYYNLGLEPCTGAPDDLASAVDPTWNAFTSVAPFSTRTWSVRVRVR
jgi:galactose mutarotase-like enzyme